MRVALVQHGVRGGHPALLRFLMPCYLAFQMGVYTEVAASAANDEEATLLRRRAERYRARLASALRAARSV